MHGKICTCRHQMGLFCLYTEPVIPRKRISGDEARKEVVATQEGNCAHEE